MQSKEVSIEGEFSALSVNVHPEALENRISVREACEDRGMADMRSSNPKKI